MRWTRSVRGRLVAGMLIVFSLGVGNVVIYLLDLDRDLREHVFNEQIAVILASIDLAPDGSNLDQLPHRFSQSDWRFSLFDGTSHLVGTSPKGFPPLPFQPPGSAPLDQRQPMTARALGNDRVLVLARNYWEECEELCQIFRDRMRGSSLLIAALAVVSLISMLLLIGWMLRSVERAAELGKLIGVEHPDRRIPLHELPSEIVPLAASANEALDRLATAYQSERRFTADAAHELRTPLTVLSLRLQKAKQEGVMDWPSLTEDLQQMQRLVGQLLALAKADSSPTNAMAVSTIHLARLMREIVADILPLYDDLDRTIDVQFDEAIVMSAPPLLISQALRNLLENALYHGHGNVLLTVSRPEPRQCTIDVEDEGPGPDPLCFEDMFDRFRKGEQSRGGSGLGLSIVRQIMRNLGGKVELVEAEKFRIRLSLPCFPIQ